MTLTDLLVALVIAVGLVGIVVPVLPGSLLVWAAIAVWATEVGSSTGWTVLAIATALLLVGGVVKYTVPGRRLRTAGVPTSTLWLGGLLGVVGFFVVPVLGLFLGFVLGVYLGERRRLGAGLARSSTVHALRAVGLSLLIELAAAVLAAGTWAVGVLLV